MANTFELISSVTVGSGGATDITFSSIPQTYTDLVLYISARGSSSAYYSSLAIYPNGVSTNMSNRWVQGYGSGANSGSASDNQMPDAVGNGATANTFGSISVYIPNYTGSTYKSMSADGVTENNATSSQAQLYADLWSNTAAITSLKIQDAFSGYTFLQHSTAYLYGVKNA